MKDYCEELVADSVNTVHFQHPYSPCTARASSSGCWLNLHHELSPHMVNCVLGEWLWDGGVVTLHDSLIRWVSPH